MGLSHLRAGVVLSVLALSCPGFAASPAVPSPSVTTATYGSWILRCVVVTKDGQPKPAGGAEDGKAVKTCEVVQTVQAQGQAEPFAQVAFGYVGSDTALLMTAVLPSNISIPGSVRVVTEIKEGSDTQVGFALAWARCVGGVCFANTKPDADSLARMRAGKTGGIAFTDAAGRTLAAPLSWVGLSQALDALNAQR